MPLSVNRVCFLKQHQQVGICNGEVWCFLCGKDYTLKYYLDELQLEGLMRGNTVWQVIIISFNGVLTGFCHVVSNVWMVCE
jgi:hypothetical protein